MPSACCACHACYLTLGFPSLNPSAAVPQSSNSGKTCWHDWQGMRNGTSCKKKTNRRVVSFIRGPPKRLFFLFLLNHPPGGFLSGNEFPGFLPCRPHAAISRRRLRGLLQGAAERLGADGGLRRVCGALPIRPSTQPGPGASPGKGAGRRKREVGGRTTQSLT